MNTLSKNTDCTFLIFMFEPNLFLLDQIYKFDEIMGAIFIIYQRSRFFFIFLFFGLAE